MIFEEYGKVGLEKAIKAAREHIEYRKECGHVVDAIERLCDKYQAKL